MIILVFFLGAAAMAAFLVGTRMGLRILVGTAISVLSRGDDTSDQVARMQVSAGRLLATIGSLLEENHDLSSDEQLMCDLERTLSETVLEIRSAIYRARARKEDANA